MACNLPWTVSLESKSLPREKQIEIIRDELYTAMHQMSINISPIKELLEILAKHTCPNWKNRFITTNWDYLIQKEINKLPLRTLPEWLADSHVYHLNGTVERDNNIEFRSEIILEEDPSHQRCVTPEANSAFNKVLWDQLFIVIGMSFECETDKSLLHHIGKTRDEMPIGESSWIIVNRNSSALEASCSRIQISLPNSKIIPVHTDIASWIKNGMPELESHGAISSQATSHPIRPKN